MRCEGLEEAKAERRTADATTRQRERNDWQRARIAAGSNDVTAVANNSVLALDKLLWQVGVRPQAIAPPHVSFPPEASNEGETTENTCH
jgi:hypothetical protein